MNIMKFWLENYPYRKSGLTIEIWGPKLKSGMNILV